MIKFRETKPEDMLMILDWIAQDKPHQSIPGAFFTERGPGVSTFAVDDDKGTVMFVRAETQGECMRMHIQFPPDRRRRVARALEEGYPRVANDAKMRGFKKIQFDSNSIALIRFLLRFRFRVELVADL